MTSPYEEVAGRLKVIIEEEFASEGFTCILDNLHESLGRKRVDIGIAPVEDVPQLGTMITQETWVEIRFYHLWKQEISPDTLINPTQITQFAERFRRAVYAANRNDPGTDQVWFFDVMRITYPNDPTGNKTRFVARVRAFGNNSALIETTG